MGTNKRKLKAVDGESAKSVKKAKTKDSAPQKSKAKALAVRNADKRKASTPATPNVLSRVSHKSKTPAQSAETPTASIRKRNSKPRKTKPEKHVAAVKSPGDSSIQKKKQVEQATRSMQQQLRQMSSTKKSHTQTAKSLALSSPCSDNSVSKYLDAYWNLPTLKHRDELPPCYFRACIFDGYRDHWSWHEATVSLFSMHNETMCIWSHLVPLLCAVAAAVWLGLQMQADGSTYVEQLMMGIFICTASICLCMSSLYHLYGCMSEGHYFCLLSFDLGGIASLIAGSFFPGVYYGFYCTPVLQKFYLGVTCLIFLVGMVISVFGATDSPNSALIRQGGFASLTIFGFVPLCHWLLIAPNAYRDEMTMGALGMFFFYGLGFSFLLTSFPESVWTNNYVTTYLVPSHALWHLGVAAAIFTWLFALLGQQQLLRDMGCQPFDDYIDEFDMRNYAF